MSLLFNGRVAIVTGAGNGLGKAYALLFGSRGAKVVVNDLGVARDGHGASSRPADDVVNEIRSKGGSAVADYHSVEDGAAIVATAISNFGRVDIVVNNAGILRDKSFARMSDADWDLVHAVHLRGAFQVTRAAFPHLKQQKYGRIIMTSSVAGIYGNFGQANYRCVAGIYGNFGQANYRCVAGIYGNFGQANYRCVAGIYCNFGQANYRCVAGIYGNFGQANYRYVAGIYGNYRRAARMYGPGGSIGTRLTQDILPPDLYEGLKPELIAPLVGWLCHEDCAENGGLFEAAGGWFGKYRFERSQGQVLRGDLLQVVSPEQVRDAWPAITSFIGALHPTSNEEAVGLLAKELQDLQEKTEGGAGGKDGITGPLSAVGLVETAPAFTYTARDVVLYALGVGASTRDADFLRYLYEGSEDFTALPTFALIAAQQGVFSSAFITGGLPSWQPDLTRLLHGEQFLELHKPLAATGATLRSTLEVVDVLDKRNGALIVAKVTTKDDVGELVATSQFLLYVAGAGKFGGRRSNAAVVPLVDAPDAAPDATVDYTTSVDQAALYRLSGDLNPLHIDPSFAAMGGFKTPILHGLCSLGIACRAVLATYCPHDPGAFRAIKVRDLPGHLLPPRPRCDVCLSGGYVDLAPSKSSSGAPTATPATTTTATAAAPAASGAPKADAFFAALGARVAAQGEKLVHKVSGVFLWNIKANDQVVSQWTVDLKTSPGSVYQGSPSGVRPDVTLTLEEQPLLELVSGKLNPQKAFMSGALKVSGNIMMSQKLKELFDEKSKL
ncbi:peroxisomal multifunctional enzyme type 2 [Hyalella azteca]|uniref:Peroxisomal multifunctional enzyme type 2 n=1 Tax=Hyalella azteca TaxID=294128 RepID=A0A979FMP6_HYAAZ|nr:peroxisomal multifunctional enzyme type 2 [Hyalella azteca]